METFQIFTLQQANAILPEVIEATEDAIERLRELEATWGKLPFRQYDALQGVAVEDLVRAEWACRIARLGILPKGYFVIDFQSPDPNTYYCWTYGEDAVTHEHKTWESFPDRRAIHDASQFESRPHDNRDENRGAPPHERERDFPSDFPHEDAFSDEP